MNAHVSQSGFPALVLNADFRPLSYYPLSLWSWQDAIKAVFLERVNIVANYDRAVHSPSFEMKLPSVVSLKTYRKTLDASRLHAVQRLPARPLRLPILRRARRPDLRSSAAALARRTHDLGQRRRRLLAVQSAQGQSDAGRMQNVAVAAAVPADRCSTCIATAGCSRRTICTIAGSIIFIGIPSSIRDRRTNTSVVRGSERATRRLSHFGLTKKNPKRGRLGFQDDASIQACWQSDGGVGGWGVARSA